MRTHTCCSWPRGCEMGICIRTVCRQTAFCPPCQCCCAFGVLVICIYQDTEPAAIVLLGERMDHHTLAWIYTSTRSIWRWDGFVRPSCLSQAHFYKTAVLAQCTYCICAWTARLKGLSHVIGQSVPSAHQDCKEQCGRDTEIRIRWTPLVADAL